MWCEGVGLLTERWFVIYVYALRWFSYVCVCIEVVYVCNFMCFVQRVELKLHFGGKYALEKLSTIIIIIIIIITGLPV